MNELLLDEIGNYNYRSKHHILEVVKNITYCPLSGQITRIGRKNSNGSIDRYGYLIIKINGLQWKAHRLAWAKHYNESPKHNIDHIDGNKLNNAISNLRDVPQALNMLNVNRKRNIDTNCVGIHYDKSTNGLLAKYTTRLSGKAYRFRTLSEAIEFRKSNKLPV